MRIIGAALGTIIASIITAHMAHMSRPWVRLQASIVIMAPPSAAMSPAHIEGHIDEVEPSERGRDQKAGQHHQPVVTRDPSITGVPA